MDEESPISQEQVESTFPSETIVEKLEEPEQVQATGTQELTYEYFDDKKSVSAPVMTETDKGRLVSMTFSKTSQKAQYEPDKVELVHSVGVDEDPEEVFVYLKELAYYLLDIPDEE